MRTQKVQLWHYLVIGSAVSCLVWREESGDKLARVLWSMTWCEGELWGGSQHLSSCLPHLYVYVLRGVHVVFLTMHHQCLTLICPCPERCTCGVSHHASSMPYLICPCPEGCTCGISHNVASLPYPHLPTSLGVYMWCFSPCSIIPYPHLPMFLGMQMWCFSPCSIIVLPLSAYIPRGVHVVFLTMQHHCLTLTCLCPKGCTCSVSHL